MRHGEPDCHKTKEKGGCIMKTSKYARMATTARAALFALAVWARAEDKPAAQSGSQAAAQEEQKQAPRAPEGTKGVLPGYRGTSLPVSGHQLMFVNKGDRVDVLVTFEANMKGGHKEKVTATILQNCIVVEVYKPAKPEEPGVIELLLNPNEAQYAALAQIQGTLHIIVRAVGDTEMHPMEMASFRKLFR